MSDVGQWTQALSGRETDRFVLKFDRLGLEAECRTLRAGEIEECRRMGGERGLRYALYLACDALREAGESLKKQGEVAVAFDVTERLAYADIVAAGGVILERSGADRPMIRMEQAGGSPLSVASDLDEEPEQLRLPEMDDLEETPVSEWEEEGRLLKKSFAAPSEGRQEEAVWETARIFADRLSAAMKNL